MLLQQEKFQLRKELWRIEDVLAGLSSSKANYKVTIDSVRNPGESRPLPAITPMHWNTDRGTKVKHQHMQLCLLHTDATDNHTCVFVAHMISTGGIFAWPREETCAFSIIVRSAFSLCKPIHGWTESCSAQPPSQHAAVYPAALAALTYSTQAKMGEWVKQSNQDTPSVHLSAFMDISCLHIAAWRRRSTQTPSPSPLQSRWTPPGCAPSPQGDLRHPPYISPGPETTVWWAKAWSWDRAVP